MANENMPYLYGKLNKEIEYLRYKFSSSDGSVFINKINGEEFNLDFSANAQALVTLRQVKKDNSPLDDPIKYYALYGYNSSTKAYDVKLGDEIVIDTSLADDSANKIEYAYVKVGEEQVYNPETGEPMYNEDGTPIMKPILQQVVVDVSQTGQLVLDNIPASAIVDTYINPETGKEELIESVLDGNVRGEVY